MPRFAPGFIEEVLERTDIVSLITDHVPSLKGAGDRFKGLCPFHDEKTPSFTVSPSKGLFFCFGCRKGGNAITFVQEMEGLPSSEAIKYLAGRAGILVRYAEGKKYEEELERRGLLEKVADHYQQMLIKSKEAETAREYLKKRGISEEIQHRFRLGYAPDEWENIHNMVRKWKIPVTDAEKAGLIYYSDRNGKYFDRFRGRIMFPITDVLGHVIAFGGRALETGEKTAKYINSPETETFKKSNTLYGLQEAREALKATGEVIITEGYMDAIALHQFGIENTVAVLGTALTNQHLRRLKRYAEKAVVVFDSDTAGLKAALRSCQSLAQIEFNAKVLTLPEGEDPDSYLRHHGREGWEKLVTQQSMLPFDFKMTMAYKSHPEKTLQAKSAVAREMLEYIVLMPRAIERSLHIGQLSGKLGIPQDSLAADLEQMKRKKMYGRSAENASPGQVVSVVSLESQEAKKGILVIALSPEFLSAIGAEEIRESLSSQAGDDQPESAIDKVFALLVDYIEETKDEWEVGSFLERLTDDELKATVTEILLSAPPVSKPEKQWHDCVTTLKRLKLEREMQERLRQFQENPSTEYLQSVHEEYRSQIEEHGRLWDRLAGRKSAGKEN